MNSQCSCNATFSQSFGVLLMALASGPNLLCSHNTALHRELSMLMQCNIRSMLRSSPHRASFENMSSLQATSQHDTESSQCSCNATLAQVSLITATPPSGSLVPRCHWEALHIHHHHHPVSFAIRISLEHSKQSHALRTVCTVQTPSCPRGPLGVWQLFVLSTFALLLLILLQ